MSADAMNLELVAVRMDVEELKAQMRVHGEPRLSVTDEIEDELAAPYQPVAHPNRRRVWWRRWLPSKERAEAMNLELVAVRIELEQLKAQVRLQTKLGFSVAEAANVTSIGETELRARIAAPEHSSRHIRVVRIGRKIVVPRSECERLLREQAR